MGFSLSLKLFILLLDSPGNQNSQLQFPLILPYKVNDTQFQVCQNERRKTQTWSMAFEGFELAKNKFIKEEPVL